MISPMNTTKDAIQAVILALSGAVMISVKAAYYVLAIMAFCKYIFN